MHACCNDLKRAITSCMSCAVMKKAVFVGAIVGCLVMFACGAALCTFLVVTNWLAPASASFQQELFFDYTKSEATASAQFCPVVGSKVREPSRCSSQTSPAPAATPITLPCMRKL